MTAAVGGPRALGLRVKLGWALGIVVSDVAGTPAVVGRLELRFAAEDGVYAYHQAMDVEPDERRGVIAEAADLAAVAATERLAAAVGEHAITRIGIVVGRGVRRIPLERILTSSQLFHTAEAEALQEGLIEATRRLLLPCVPITFSSAEGHEAWPVISRLGKVAGRPWRKDEKLAATAAWAALRHPLP